MGRELPAKRDDRPSLLRRVFDERTFSGVLDRVLLVAPLVGTAGWAVGWVTGRLSDQPSPGDVGLMFAVGLGVTYAVGVRLGTVIFSLWDRRARTVRRLQTRSSFEANWTDSAAAASRALGRVRSEEPIVTQDLWQLADDRPRAVVMEAFSRLERHFSATSDPSTAAFRAYESLRRLRQLAVLHEFGPPPEKAREFLDLCDRTAAALTTPRG